MGLSVNFSAAVGGDRNCIYRYGNRLFTEKFHAETACQSLCRICFDGLSFFRDCFIGIVVQCHTRYCYRYECSLFDSRRTFAQWGYRYRREPYFAGDYPLVSALLLVMCIAVGLSITLAIVHNGLVLL